jgi:hypothetical protein
MHMTMKTKRIPERHVGRGQQAGPLTVFPVWTGAQAIARLVMGLAAEVSVAELEGSPVVGELIVTNKGNSHALLVEGELLEGGWQHRALQHDVILRPSGSMVAPVVCVEAGRWQGGGAHVRRARRASGNVRAAMNATDESRRQQQVWHQVSRYDRSMGASPTSSYVDHVDRMRQRVDVTNVPVLDGQRGVVIGLAGQPVLLELFPSHECMAAALPALISGLMLDAMSAAAPTVITPGRRARRLVERLDERRAHLADEVNAGDAIPFSLVTEHAAVRGVSLDEQWAHLTVFNRRHPLVEVS